MDELKPYEINATKKLIKNALLQKYISEKNLEMISKTLEDFPLVGDSLRLLLEEGVIKHEIPMMQMYQIVKENIHQFYTEPGVADFGTLLFRLKYYFRQNDLENTKQLVEEVKPLEMKPVYKAEFYYTLLMLAQPRNDSEAVIECADFFERHQVTDALIKRESSERFEGDVSTEEYLIF